MAIRVLIVDDSIMAREILREIFQETQDFVVIGEATNGQEAITLVAQHQPDLITMDLEMPVMDGYEAIYEIMHTKAYPILVVSSVADAKNAYRAISNGAVDAIGKPGILVSEQEVFIKKARLVSSIPVIKRIRPSVPLHTRKPQQQVTLNTSPRSPVALASTFEKDRIICFASSTGGPQALAEILKDITPSFNVPILIAQHISDGFAAGMAEWLDGISPLKVKLAQDGETVIANTVYLSPSEKNMTVTREHRISLLEPTSQDIYHPSCNRLLESIADVYGGRSIGIILSGMGSDGAAGLKKILEHGGITIGQDEESSIIYGMNQVAMNTGAVKIELPLKEIVRAIENEIGFRLPSCVGASNAN